MTAEAAAASGRQGPRPAGLRFDHLMRLAGAAGVYEHARYTAPRRGHGYCLDDNARALLLLARCPALPAEVEVLERRCLAFVAAAQACDGAFHNRRARDGRWTDAPGTGDWWGRALWALGTVTSRGRTPRSRALARRLFDRGAQRRSPWPRAMAYAALGAAEVVARDPSHVRARALAIDAMELLDRPGAGAGWPWPERRLSYANAVWPEALIAGGVCLGDGALARRGLALLEWLVAVESRDGHLSVTPAGGWERGDARPGFDQQPIEVAALAEACSRALGASGDAVWRAHLQRAVAWFHGDNDRGVPLADPVSGGGCDGLTPTGRNANQGAESTVALLATLHLA